MTEAHESEAWTRSGRTVGAALAVGVLLIVGYFVMGMPGMDHSGGAGDGAMASMDHGSMPFMRLDPDAFAARLARPSTFVINVHTPYAGDIDGTDAFIPYDQIAGDSRLPEDKDAEVALYCRSGSMSKTAAEALNRAGFTNVVDREGGLESWQAAGLPVRLNQR